MSFESPEESHPLPCSRCEHAFAEVDGQCAACAVMSRIDDDDLQGAFNLASDYGIDVVAVGMMIQSSTEHRVRAEMHNSAFRTLRAALEAHHDLNETARNDPWLTTEQAAQLLGVSTHEMFELKFNGAVPTDSLGFIRRSDLLARRAAILAAQSERPANEVAHTEASAVAQ